MLTAQTCHLFYFLGKSSDSCLPTYTLYLATLPSKQNPILYPDLGTEFSWAIIRVSLPTRHFPTLLVVSGDKGTQARQCHTRLSLLTSFWKPSIYDKVDELKKRVSIVPFLSFCFAFLWVCDVYSPNAPFNNAVTSIGMKIQHPELSEYNDVKTQNLDDIFEQQKPPFS